MNPREPRVLGSRIPAGSPSHLMVRVDSGAIPLIDRAAAAEGLQRSDFIKRAISAAVRDCTGEELP